MKVEKQILTKHLKRLNPKQEIIHSSVSFESVQSNKIVQPKGVVKDLFVDMEEALNSGDDTIWRMWR